jgi:3-methyl-2-oxobutanoate hydroxymethyltransferase
VPVTVEDLLLMTKAVTRSTKRALIVADLPFGSYESGPAAGLRTAVRMMKEGGAQAVKLEGGVRVAPQTRLLTENGIPVMAHVGLHAAERARPRRLPGAGPRRGCRAAARRRARRPGGRVPSPSSWRWCPRRGRPGDQGAVHPDDRHRRRVDCDAQVLVWPDMAGLNGGPGAEFVKKYADLRGELLRAAREYADEVRSGVFPGPSTPSTDPTARGRRQWCIAVGHGRTPRRATATAHSRRERVLLTRR